jgi:hypothetical protein
MSSLMLRSLAFKSLAFKSLSLAAVLSTVAAMPLVAQEVISEPGYCAFFYPNANCQNKGPGNPYTDPNYQRSANAAAGWWSNAPVIAVPPRRARVHRSNSVARGMY